MILWIMWQGQINGCHWSGARAWWMVSKVQKECMFISSSLRLSLSLSLSPLVYWRCESNLHPRILKDERRASFAPSLKPSDMKLDCYSAASSSVLCSLALSLIKWIAKSTRWGDQQTVCRGRRAPASLHAKNTARRERLQERKRGREEERKNDKWIVWRSFFSSCSPL